MAWVFGILIAFYGFLSRISVEAIEEFIFKYLASAFGMLAFVSFVSFFITTLQVF